jgi:hypothetical protein
MLRKNAAKTRVGGSPIATSIAHTIVAIQLNTAILKNYGIIIFKSQKNCIN